jgi:hypothetical protein
MSDGRPVRENMNATAGLKAAAIILTLLFGCIIARWIATRLRHAEEPLPDPSPHSEKSTSEKAPPTR